MCSGLYDNGVSSQETIKCLFEVWKMIHVRRGKVRSDEDWLMYPVDNFVAHHVCYVEARGINVPFL